MKVTAFCRGFAVVEPRAENAANLGDHPPFGVEFFDPLFIMGVLKYMARLLSNFCRSRFVGRDLYPLLRIIKNSVRTCVGGHSGGTYNAINHDKSS